MSIFPIPAAYVDAGNGPGQLAVRDGQSLIPGVPVIYNRMMSDETAQVTAKQIASGWPKMIPLLGSDATTPSTTNTIFLDAQSGCELMINGYRLTLPREIIPIELTNPPATGFREDLIFLETWFIRTEAGRVMQYRFRVVPNVVFSAYPDGMTDPAVVSQDENGTPTTAVYQTNPTQFASNDQGLWWSLRAGLVNDPLSERGLNDTLYRISWALPIARVRRSNSTAYNALTNANGAPAYSSTTPSPRPDNGYNDALHTEYDIVDLRHFVSFRLPDQQILRRSFTEYLTNKITSNGAARRVAVALNDAHYGTLRSDLATLDTLAIPVNLVRYSHFVTDINTDGLADGWAAYQSGSATGTRSMATPDGQVIARTGGSSSDGWGITAAVVGVVTNTLTLQIGYTVNSASAGSTLTVRARDTATNATAILEPITGLASMTVGQTQTFTQTYEVPAWTSGLIVDVYIAGGNANVTLDYVDLRPDRRVLPVMRVTDGSFYPVTLPAALAPHGCTLVATGASMHSGITANSVAGTIVVVDSVLEFRPSIPPTNADVRLTVGLSYTGADGLSDVLTAGVDKAWDKNGIVLSMAAADASKSYTATELGLAIATGETMRAWNPASSNKGAVATIRLDGNGTGTYTIPSTRYGRKVLWPIDCRVSVNTSQTLSNIVQNSNGTLTFTLSGGAIVSTGQYIYVDVVLAMPLLTWTTPGLGNGVGKLAVGQLISTKVIAQSTVVVLTAPGVLLGVISSLVCSPIIRAGTGESLGTTVITSVNSTTVKLTFPTPVAAGTVIQVLALVRQEFHPDVGLAIGYKTDTLAPYTYVGTDEITFLTDPVLLVHTKGTGGHDSDPDWGAEAFMRLPTLDSRLIAQEGHTPTRSVLADVPFIRNRASNMPLAAGRTLQMMDLNDGDAIMESHPLTTSAPHETVLAALISLRGRRLLLILNEVRSDARTALTSSAAINLYEPTGRPVAPGEL